MAKKLQKLQVSRNCQKEGRSYSKGVAKVEVEVKEETTSFQGLTWSWRILGQGSRYWNLSIKFSIRR